MLRTRAPAKINLTLHVLRRRPDGYHDLDSLVAFATVADLLALEPGRSLGLVVDGPTAGAAGPSSDNLVLRAAKALAERVPGLELGLFHLTKRLPVGAGIGGGSSDAAAALRLLARQNGLALDDRRVEAAARATGSDVPVCVVPRMRIMRGTGDRLEPPLRAKPMAAVLANPGIHVDTRSVFLRMGLKPGEDRPQAIPPRSYERLDAGALREAAANGRNDMEEAAMALAPGIAEVLAMLRATRDASLVRMSGSGSTCFALYPGRSAARAAAAAIKAERPEWWVRPTMLM